MTLVTDRIEYAEVDAPPSLSARLIAATRRHVRLTIALSFLIICACFAAATLLQMRRDYDHALALAAGFTSAQAEVQASEAAQKLERLAAMGTAYMDVLDGFGAGYVIEASEGMRLLNIALTNREGRFVRAMRGEADVAAPLSAEILQRLQSGPVIAPYSDAAIGSSPMTLFFAAGGNLARIVVMPVDPVSLLPRDVLGNSALFTPGGVALALSNNFALSPPVALLSNREGAVTRQLEQDGVRSIVAAAPVPGWPLTAVASVEASAALGTWYGSIPLYLFVILGPGLVGAALAVLLVSEFERADRARSALVSLKILQQSRARPPRTDTSPPKPRDEPPAGKPMGLSRFR
jgi:hypothetical protein